ncbi:hypothetical protein EJ06DRAFT_579565 [Trichodelitschia bisporula]|uniref:Uncharacterized protein n=1 Tax=Trichodelitschia bisporula TaxID=703511 RepID=A0A6G1I6F6_9PEZI|nr:hypothetical protein EJ06DRAFT_579565 [Trichodelitschia bisporula]
MGGGTDEGVRVGGVVWLRRMDISACKPTSLSQDKQDVFYIRRKDSHSSTAHRRDSAGQEIYPSIRLHTYTTEGVKPPRSPTTMKTNRPTPSRSDNHHHHTIPYAHKTSILPHTPAVRHKT